MAVASGTYLWASKDDSGDDVLAEIVIKTRPAVDDGLNSSWLVLFFLGHIYLSITDMETGRPCGRPLRLLVLTSLRFDRPELTVPPEPDLPVLDGSDDRQCTRQAHGGVRAAGHVVEPHEGGADLDRAVQHDHVAGDHPAVDGRERLVHDQHHPAADEQREGVQDREHHDDSHAVVLVGVDERHQRGAERQDGVGLAVGVELGAEDGSVLPRGDAVEEVRDPPRQEDEKGGVPVTHDREDDDGDDGDCPEERQQIGQVAGWFH